MKVLIFNLKYCKREVLRVNTEKTLYDKFLNFKSPSWRTHKLKEVDIDYVMWHLVIKNFAVEIDGHKYDITFGLNCNNEMGHSISMEGSPSLTTRTVINRGFKEGKWFEILEEELSKEEKESIEKEIKEREEKEFEQFVLERLGVSSVEDIDLKKY